MKYSEILDTVQILIEGCEIHQRRGQVLFAALHTNDKVLMRQMQPTMYHMIWDLHRLRETLPELNSIPIEPPVYTETTYESAEHIEREKIRFFLEEWCDQVENLTNSLYRIKSALEQFKMKPTFLWPLADLRVDILFFRKFFKAFGGSH